ncbi:uncharacterized protein LOC127808508 [Diospyros lotus]|uniref:uncharacterized protein LOC127808508 n=1 Tax=Diospyros lotus TaxID=55363 RepID=UPI00224E9C64|nr:uncharacterized protein LOC127808508 [Diospyros lotus]XP_052203049.1 uncharacterized protein LOC127808508 [Diospyros lotus]
METEDFIELSSSSNSGCDNKKREPPNPGQEPGEADSQTSNLDVKKDKPKEKALGTDEADVENGSGTFFPAAETDRDLIGSSVVKQVSAEVNGDLAVTEEVNDFSARIPTENDCSTFQAGSPIGRQKRDGSPVIEAIIGVKKARMTVDEQQQPSVHVIYNSLTRDSKHKLEELLQQWSEWHAQHCSPAHDSIDVLESGQETYFPALCVGPDNLSAVSFWMDNQPRNQQKEFIPLDSQSVPLYDRGYSLALTSTDSPSNLEGGLQLDSFRCFNCGSYNHTLRDCPKPRDNVAVNNARKEHKSKRNQNASSRNPTRYYQTSPGGKYDGLKPGVLEAETRQLLGLGELDPPPWLNRMREIGYPPGYLDPQDEDQPSGIIIFTEEDSMEEKEDGEILETNIPQPPRKMSVKFPGVNAPIPEKADENRWAAGPSSSDLSRNRSQRRGQHHEQRRSRDFRDEGPPGVDDPGFSYSSSSYSERHGSYEHSYSFQSARGNILIPRSPSYGRSLSDRGRSQLYREGSPVHGSYGSVPYSPPNRVFSPRSYGSPSFGRREDYNRNDSEPYLSPHHHERQHSHNWR